MRYLGQFHLFVNTRVQRLLTFAYNIRLHLTASWWPTSRFNLLFRSCILWPFLIHILNTSALTYMNRCVRTRKTYLHLTFSSMRSQIRQSAREIMLLCNLWFHSQSANAQIMMCVHIVTFQITLWRYAFISTFISGDLTSNPTTQLYRT